MGLALTTSQVYKLELAHDLSVVALSVKLVHSEWEYAVGTARILIHLVAGHNFVFLALVKIGQSIFNLIALENINVFYENFVCGHIPFQLQARLFFIRFLSQILLCTFVQQIVNSFVIELNILNWDHNSTSWIVLSSNLRFLKKIPDRSWNQAVLCSRLHRLDTFLGSW